MLRAVAAKFRNCSIDSIDLTCAVGEPNNVVELVHTHSTSLTSLAVPAPIAIGHIPMPLLTSLTLSYGFEPAAMNAGLFPRLTYLSLPYLSHTEMPPAAMLALRHLDVTIDITATPNTIAWLQALPSLTTLDTNTVTAASDLELTAFLTAMHATLASYTLPRAPVGPDVADALRLCSKLTSVTINSSALHNYRVLLPLTTLTSLLLDIGPESAISPLMRAACVSSLTSFSLYGKSRFRTEEVPQWHLPHLRHFATNLLSIDSLTLVLRKFTTLCTLAASATKGDADFVAFSEAVKAADRRGMEEIDLDCPPIAGLPSSLLRWLSMEY